jgi:hypothetical protein
MSASGTQADFASAGWVARAIRRSVAATTRRAKHQKHAACFARRVKPYLAKMYLFPKIGTCALTHAVPRSPQGRFAAVTKRGAGCAFKHALGRK